MRDYFPSSGQELAQSEHILMLVSNSSREHRRYKSFVGKRKYGKALTPTGHDEKDGGGPNWPYPLF